MNLAKRFFLTLFALTLFSGAFAQQHAFSEAQTADIACAKAKLIALYNFLDASQPEDKKVFIPSACGSETPIPMPKWLQDLLVNEMQTRVLWQIPSASGRIEYLNEAELWRRTFAVVFEFLTLVEKINDGSTFSSLDIMEQFGKIRTNLLIETDRLNTDPVLIGFNMRESMQGRGRALLATLDLINSEMNSVAESFIVAPKLWRSKFVKSVEGVVVLSNSMYGDIVNNASLPMPDTYKRGKNNSTIVFLLMLIGMLAIFFSVYKFTSDKNDEITKAIEKYIQKSSAWADDYSRQFLDINVKYIVLITLCAFSVIGVIFGMAVGGFVGFIMFAICFAMGLYSGLKMPGIILKFLKRRRGEKINNQLMDALILLSNSLKSGMDIVQGFDMVSHDLQPPISDEFALVIKNYKLGTPFEKALEGMEERVESRLLSYMVKA
ncbi:MAG: type II secretion system F family protein, partial [Elusimicrobiota bacterium]|nr:type II secretion system F family protein [Elusimicrobiota bacterium]